MITIVNYGLGNINAFINVYKRLDIVVKVAEKPQDLHTADKIILPGVGHFDHAINKLNNSGMRDKLDELVLDRKVPVIGICVGMQMMAEHSEEGSLSGLGWIKGNVKKIDASKIQYRTKLPHMGWNDVRPVKDNLLFKNLEKDAQFYFLHSYYFECLNDDVLAVSDYGAEFASAVNHKNCYGIQFHPEKSHHFGQCLLHNFAKI